jgi:hypothetical protein
MHMHQTLEGARQECARHPAYGVHQRTRYPVRGVHQHMRCPVRGVLHTCVKGGH